MSGGMYKVYMVYACYIVFPERGFTSFIGFLARHYVFAVLQVLIIKVVLATLNPKP